MWILRSRIWLQAQVSKRVCGRLSWCLQLQNSAQDQGYWNEASCFWKPWRARSKYTKTKEHLPKSQAHADGIWSTPGVVEMTTVKALANEALMIRGSKDNPKLSTPISLFRNVTRRKGNTGNRSPALAGGTAFLKFCQFWEPKCSNFIGLGFGSGGGGGGGGQSVDVSRCKSSCWWRIGQYNRQAKIHWDPKVIWLENTKTKHVVLFRNKSVNLLCCMLSYSLIGEPCALFIPIPDVMTSNPWCCSPGRINHVHGQSVAILSVATRSKAWLVSRVGSLLFACNPAKYTGPSSENTQTLSKYQGIPRLNRGQPQRQPLKRQVFKFQHRLS